MMQTLRSFFTKPTNHFFILLSTLLALNSLFLISSQGSFLPSFHIGISKLPFYFIYLIITGSGFLFILSKKIPLKFDFIASVFLMTYFPTITIFIYALQNNHHFTSYAGPFTAFYVALLTYVIIRLNLKKNGEKIPSAAKKHAKKNYPALMIIIITMLISFSFGLFHLGKLAVVDEPLWTFDRIPNFWRDLGKREWRDTNVSDKPGLTVAVISGAGLFFEKEPKSFKEIVASEENSNVNADKMDAFNIAFRLPILIFVILMLPFFYLFIKRMAGEASALFSVIFIALSPIILGNSRIINPDSILWIFTSLSIITFLLYLKEDKKSDLILSAFFLGLSILTKYTGNILYFFFIGLIFTEYIFNHSRYEKIDFSQYFRKHLSNYFLLVFVSFATFFVFYPAAWGKPMRLFNSTISSQAVEPVWPIFASVLFFFLCDLAFFRNNITKSIIKLLVPFKKLIHILIIGIFLSSIAFVLLNTYSGMAFSDFQNILASPKSSYIESNIFAFFAANFYPLVFGVSIVSILSLVTFLIISLRKNIFLRDNLRTVIYLCLFILVYYLGSVATQVASIIRYQIIVFPIFMIAAAISLQEILHILFLQKKFNRIKFQTMTHIFSIVIIIASFFSLWQVRPFYMGYASALLPAQYFLDIKDMGEGSYEAAQYLNSLPDAKKTAIWTDKQGVCVFFVGKCYTTISQKTFSETKIDYLVMSSGRKSRTTKLRGDLFFHNINLKDIYETDQFEKLIPIANRENNNVKIIKTDAIAE